MYPMMYIKKSFILILCTFMVISCNKDMFDAEEYKQLAEKEQPVDYIDASHIWELTTDYSINVETNNVVPEAKRLLILSGDPTSGRSSNILGEYIRPGGNYHCFNIVENCIFDLTSEQFGDEILDYSVCKKQSRETHFANAEKRKRYEYLKARITEYCKERNESDRIT